MSATWQKKWGGGGEKRSSYSPFRRTLLWVRDIGLAVDVMLCMVIALFANPTVLSDHPWLKSYVDFMAGYFSAVDRLSVGALHPQVSQLVFAVGWGVALIPFVASFLHSAIYLLGIDFKRTKAEMEVKYDIKTKLGGHILEKFSTPIVAVILMFFLLGDLGLINNFGWVNGILMTKANSLNSTTMSQFSLLLYTSRWGLGIVASTLIYVGVLMYSAMWTLPVFYLPIWLRRRLIGQRAS